MTHRLVLFAYLVSSVACVACGSSNPPAETPAEQPPAEQPPAGQPEAQPPTQLPPDATQGSASRPPMTAQECEASGGSVVGDIGDGAIHRPDYVCPSGAAPVANIQSHPDGPVAVEGAVCCPP